jgi:ABC-type dipeptide/oligopeptide/nickel transport system ATPase component
MYQCRIVKAAAHPVRFRDSKHLYAKALLPVVFNPDPDQKINGSSAEGCYLSPRPPAGCRSLKACR